MKLKIRKKDKVVVIAGKDKGKVGEVLRVYPDEMRVLVGKVNIVTKHQKRRGTEPGGLQKREAPIAYSNVMLLCPKCEKPTRPKLETTKTKESVRACRECGTQIV